MFALCASSTSWRSCGTAYELICPSSRLPLGTSSVVTSTIFPPEIRTCTCTGPQRVCATVPLTRVAAPAAGAGAVEAVGPVVAPGTGSDAAGAGAAPVTIPGGAAPAAAAAAPVGPIVL